MCLMIVMITIVIRVLVSENMAGQNAYMVVKFMSDKCVEIVHSSWVTETHERTSKGKTSRYGKCYWPIKRSIQVAEGMLLKPWVDALVLADCLPEIISPA